MKSLHKKHHRRTEIDSVCTENTDADLNLATRFRSKGADFGPAVSDSRSRKAKSGDAREPRECMCARDHDLATCTLNIPDSVSVRPSPTTARTVYAVIGDWSSRHDADAELRAFRIRNQSCSAEAPKHENADNDLPLNSIQHERSVA